MRPPCRLCVPPKTRRVDLEERAITRQQLGKHVTVATNIHATIDQLLDAVSSKRAVSHQNLCKTFRRLNSASVLRYKPTQLGPIDRASPYLPIFARGRRQTPVSETSFRTVDSVKNSIIISSMPSSRTLRQHVTTEAVPGSITGPPCSWGI
jgi:hypothetical protein